jgi:hypothetical protein
LGKIIRHGLPGASDVNMDLPAAARPAPIPQPEPDMTPERLFERAIALRNVLREQQDEADERGAYSPEIH